VVGFPEFIPGLRFILLPVGRFVKKFGAKLSYQHSAVSYQQKQGLITSGRSRLIDWNNTINFFD
jgi:hypothetical protein